MEHTRQEMIDKILQAREKHFNDELEKYKHSIENLSDDKLLNVYKSIIKEE
jgi:hypothetical protein